MQYINHGYRVYSAYIDLRTEARGRVYAPSRSHDSYNTYTNCQVRTPFLLACGMRWKSAALLGSGEFLQRKSP